MLYVVLVVCSRVDIFWRLQQEDIWIDVLATLPRGMRKFGSTTTGNFC